MLSGLTHHNIPTEIIRTTVAVAETGSLTQAAKQLGISQPAVTSQIKRIEDIIGGSLFTKTANGSMPTDLGQLFLDQARRMLDANDQMLRLGGVSRDLQTVRFGISSVFLRDFLSDRTMQPIADMSLQIDNCVGLGKSMVDGRLDVAYILEHPKLPSELLGLVIDDYQEDFAWVRSPKFSLTPGRPIPILIWPGDNFAIQELTRRGLTYDVVFNSTDYHAKLAAAEAGLGITAMPRRLLPDGLVADDDDYLPKLPPVRALLCARPTPSMPTQHLIDRIAARYFRGNSKG